MPSYAQRCIEEARPFLQGHGQIASQYITASLDPIPFSNQPDLVFVPGIGPNANIAYVVEFKEGQFGRLDMALLKLALEHQIDVLRANPDASIVYLLVTPAELSHNQVTWCQNRKLRVLQHVSNGAELATILRVWAALPD